MNIISLSFGKDSMATLILAAESGIRIDRVMYCDVRFSPDLSGEHPLMAEWIPKAEQRLKELFGITVDHAYSGISFLEQFYAVKGKGSHIGQIYGFPLTLKAWCNERLKVKAINNYISQFKNQEITQFVGIAYDEPKRWERMKAKETEKRKYRSLLVENKLTEQDAMSICRKYDLISPIYETDGIFRGGCWFCSKQCIPDLYSLWKNHPDYYNRLVKIEPDSYNTFKPRGVTLARLAERFENGYVPNRKKRNPFVQLDFFDKLED